MLTTSQETPRSSSSLMKYGVSLGALAGWLLALLFTTAAPALAMTVNAIVVDAATKLPIDGAYVTVIDKLTRTGSNGVAAVNLAGAKAIGFKAWGYQRKQVPSSELAGPSPQVALTPFQPKALYLSFSVLRFCRHFHLRSSRWE